MAGLSGISKHNAVSFIRRESVPHASTPKALPKSETVHLGGKSVQLPLGDQPAVVGRSSGSDLKVPNLMVSGRHAELKKEGEALKVRDLGSTNGTYVDGQLLQGDEWATLHPKSQISLGRDPTNLISLSGQPSKDIEPHAEAQAEFGQKVDLPAEGSEFLWGRDSKADHSFSGDKVSRKHLAIRKNAGAYWVKDLGSSNGTYLGGEKPIESHKWFEVKEGTRIDLGGQVKLTIGPKTAPPPPPPPSPSTVEPSLPSAKLKPMTEAQSQAILGKAKVDPSALGRAEGVADLTTDFLAKEGFGPQNTIELGDSKLHLSKPYRHADRTCAVGYVEQKDGSVSVRTMYRSGSHGLWKVASHAGRDGWFGKGESQESVTLPLDAQEALAGVKTKGEESPQGKQLFYGALEISGLAPPRKFFESMEHRSLGLPEPSHDKYPEPSDFRLTNPNEGPNFSKPTRSFDLQSEVQGKVKASVFASKDGESEFMFCQDDQGRAWLGGVFSTKSEVNSFGVNKEWVRGKKLTAPAADYMGSHRVSYAGKHVSGKYYDYSSFTEKIPVVADFLKSQQR